VSIDLYLDLVHPVPLRPLLKKAGAVLAKMLALDTIPELTLEALSNGQRKPVTDEELRDDRSPFFLISIAGEPETVALSVPGRHVTVIMGAMRNSLEYALGAAVSIALAEELHVEVIGDDSRFFGADVEVSPVDLLRRLEAAEPGHDYRAAAEQLGCRLNWQSGTGRLTT
jgi:hypothetical protein